VRAATVLVGTLLLCATALWRAPASEAAGEPVFGCGHEHRSKAEFNPYGTGPPPVAIGDSTMLLPIPDLNAVGFNVDAKGCRGFKQAVWVARELRNRGELGPVVTINSYGNGGINPGLIKFALKVLGPDRTLVLVTAYNADTGEPPAPNTEVLVQAAEDHPDQIKLLDWVEYSLPHHKVEPEPGAWFLPDLFHPNFDGAHAYADFLAQVLPEQPGSNEEGDDDGIPWWPFALGAAALLVVGALVRRLRH
jgi:hypothetical protein